MRLNLREWTWNGRKLTHPLSMVRRTIGLAIMLFGTVFVVLGAFVGWGLDEARGTWRNLP